MKADSRSSVASTLKSLEVDVDEEMDTATPEDIEAKSRREEALEAITARNSKCINRSTAAVCVSPFEFLVWGLSISFLFDFEDCLLDKYRY